MIWEGLQVPTLEGFTGFVPPQGDGTSHVMIMGEAPGEHEAKESIPFHPKAPAGSTFDRLLRRAGLEREPFTVCNSVWSRPPNNYLEGSAIEGQAIASFAPFRDRAFELYRPRVFFALGNIALKTLTPYGQGKGSISHVQGYVLDGPYDGTWVIGGFHPSAIMQGLQGLSGVFIWALQRAIEIGKHGFVRERLPLILHPSLDDMLAFERGYNPDVHRLDFDIETPESGELEEEDLAEADDETQQLDRELSFTIIRASLCYERYAISFPWASPYREIAARMLASRGHKGVWNEDFDVPRLNLDGARVNGRIYDWMKYWKHLQPSLPTKLKCRSLEFVSPFYGWTGEPWKSLNSSQPEFYSACDSLALKRNGDGIERDLRSKGAWQRAESHITDVYQVLTTMSRNGLPYSADKAHAFEIELQQKWDERFAELQRVIPDELKPSKQKQGYKKVPKDTTGLACRMFKVLGSDLTAEECSVSSPGQYDIVTVMRWCVLEPFLPTSTQQVQALLKYHGLPVGKNRKTKNDSADDEHLRKMIKRTRGIKKHAQLTTTLQMIRECKQLSKVLGTYVKGWRPGSDGRIHATPGYWGKMFRVSWRRPNISATIQDKTEEYVATGFRKCVAVAAGRVLLECDWKGIEAVLVGWFAGDTDYMRLARLGVHDYMGIHMAGGTVELTLPDQQLQAMFREFKRDHPKLRDDAKHIVHGTNYLMQPRLMSDMYEIPERECKRLQGMYYELFPKIKRWQNSVLDRASRECKLTNPFTYSMPFFEVYRWDSKRGVWALGEDAKAAVAFLPRDTAAAMLKEVLLRLRFLAEQGILLASTHDSLTCEVAEWDLIRVATLLKTEMERPVPELGGLSIGVELKAGSAWHESELQTLDLTPASPHPHESSSADQLSPAYTLSPPA